MRYQLAERGESPFYHGRIDAIREAGISGATKIISCYQKDIPMLGGLAKGNGITVWRLDKKVKSTAMALAISVGTIGLLIFGLGLTMVLEWEIYLWGILVGLIGAIPCALAMPLYLLSMKKGKKKYGERILELSSELLGENNEIENNEGAN